MLKKTSFTDLAPSDNLEDISTYSEALTEALESPRVRNIALTGPYGSGKSSILCTYEKQNTQYKFLNISLASFSGKNSEPEKADNLSEIDSQNIEKSILQQIIYSTDAANLPHSRLSRISTPNEPEQKSLLAILALLLGYLVGSDISKLNDLASLHALEIACLLVSFACLLSVAVYAASVLYRQTFNMSLKSISLTNAQIEQRNDSEESVLNRYLDEILYFFESTDYNVVVIEDLDRFGSSDIFTKLREINTLINKRTQRTVNFIYAIRDDMFGSVERAKFFEFIIPVLPVVNTANSSDMMLNQLNELNLSVDQIFIKDISLFINDKRLINNILNEFRIYQKQVNSKALNVTRLFAMIVYKNIYPSDFEDLHHNQGMFFRALKESKTFLQEKMQKIKIKISNIKSDINKAEKECFSDKDELAATYMMSLVRILNEKNRTFNQIQIGNHELLLKNKINHQDLLKINSDNLAITTNPHYGSHRSNISFSHAEKSVNPDISFRQRCKNIDIKAAGTKSELRQKIVLYENQIRDLKRSNSLKDRCNEEFLSELLSEYHCDTRLLKYLILDGYLDDDYQDYISIFHEGTISSSDHQFILNMRSRGTPDIHAEIHTPDEVIAQMHPSDLFSDHALNITLMDYLIRNPKPLKSQHPQPFSDVLSYLYEQGAENQISCDFLREYDHCSDHINIFTREIFTHHPDFLREEYPSDIINMYIIRVFQSIGDSSLLSKIEENSKISDHINQNAEEILQSEYFLNLDLADLSCLDSVSLKIPDLSAISENTFLIRYLHENNYYELNPGNIALIVRNFGNSQPSEDELKEANYTSCMLYGSSKLKEYIQNNIRTYLHGVFFKLPSNKETIELLVELINSEGLDDYHIEGIIDRQENNLKLPTLHDVTEAAWIHLIDGDKIQLDWSILNELFFDDEISKVISSEQIVCILNEKENISKLSKQSMKEIFPDKTQRLKLSREILNFTSIDTDNYIKLVKNLPFWYEEFPKQSDQEKNLLLIKNWVVRLTQLSFKDIYDDRILAALIEFGFEEYKQEKNHCDQYLTNDIRTLLLNSSLNDDQKILIGSEMDFSEALSSDTINAMLHVVSLDKFPLEDLPLNVMRTLLSTIKNTEAALKLVIRLIASYSKNNLFSMISVLPNPYSEISIGGKRPSLPISPNTKLLAEKLKEQNYISSYSEKKDKIRVNTFKTDHLSSAD